MAGTTGLEPATSAVTGQRSNQLSYVPSLFQQLIYRAKSNVLPLSPFHFVAAWTIIFCSFETIGQQENQPNNELSLAENGGLVSEAPVTE